MTAYNERITKRTEYEYCAKLKTKITNMSAMITISRFTNNLELTTTDQFCIDYAPNKNARRFYWRRRGIKCL